MDDPAQESTSRQNNRSRSDLFTIGKNGTRNLTIIENEVGHLTLYDGQILLALGLGQHFFPIDSTVSLRPRALNSWPLAAIQKTELDAGFIRDTPHNAVQRVNLAHQMPLTQTTDSRIAGHHPDPVARHRDQSSIRAHTRGCVGRFGSGMAATDNYHVKMFHVKHSIYFPKQKLEKITSSRFSTSIRPTSASSARIEWRSSSDAISY